jgi:hypothetical protein
MQAQTRTVKGKVVNADGRPLKGAVVQLKDLRTLRIRSFVTEAGGAFFFPRLDSDVDYEVRAHIGEGWSESVSVSRFDSAPVIELTLKVETGKS